MLSDLYNYVSLLFSWRWPKAEGTITSAQIQRVRELRVVIEYKFNLGADGPYTGESSQRFLSMELDCVDITERFRPGAPVTIRYRPDDPSVSTLDRDCWDLNRS